MGFYPSTWNASAVPGELPSNVRKAKLRSWLCDANVKMYFFFLHIMHNGHNTVLCKELYKIYLIYWT